MFHLLINIKKILLPFLRTWQEEVEQTPMKRHYLPHKTAALYSVSFTFASPTISAQQLQHNPAITSQGILKLFLLFASWKWLENRKDWGITVPVFWHYKGRTNRLRAGSSSVMLVSGGHWNKLQPSLVTCKWQCQVREMQDLLPDSEDAPGGASALNTCTLACFYSWAATKCSVPGAERMVSLITWQ